MLSSKIYRRDVLREIFPLTGKFLTVLYLVPPQRALSSHTSGVRSNLCQRSFYLENGKGAKKSRVFFFFERPFSLSLSPSVSRPEVFSRKRLVRCGQPFFPFLEIPSAGNPCSNSAPLRTYGLTYVRCFYASIDSSLRLHSPPSRGRELESQLGISCYGITSCAWYTYIYGSMSRRLQVVCFSHMSTFFFSFFSCFVIVGVSARKIEICSEIRSAFSRYRRLITKPRSNWHKYDEVMHIWIAYCMAVEA